MANGNGVVPDQDIFDHEPYDSLALSDTKRFRSSAQAGEERREGVAGELLFRQPPGMSHSVAGLARLELVVTDFKGVRAG